jgi:hypothetical protein
VTAHLDTLATAPIVATDWPTFRVVRDAALVTARAVPDVAPNRWKRAEQRIYALASIAETRWEDADESDRVRWYSAILNLALDIEAWRFIGEELVA